MRRSTQQRQLTPNAYRIQVQGCVAPRWSDWFGGLTVNEDRDAGGLPVTTLSGIVPDQAALRGIVNRLWDLNLTLITVERLAPPVESEVNDERHARPRTFAPPSGQ
jgi:hypothetical protein